jgi:N-acetylneuraminate synthase
MKPTLIIAEAGVNHNGSRELGYRLIDAAVDAGADVVKFQSFRADALATAAAPKAAYQKETTGEAQSQYAMLKALEMSEDMHRALQAHAHGRGIEFLSTPFDEGGVDLLQSLALKRLKLPSGELTNGPFLLHAARAGLPLILSSGMATMAEVETALGVIAFGLTAPADAPASRTAFDAAYRSERGQQMLRSQVTVLHCTTQYPAPDSSANLLAIPAMQKALGVPIGYSDHTEGIAVSIAAVALGACMIEKHLTLDKTMEGPDHRASAEPDEMAAMVAAIRSVERALGDGIKAPQAAELANIPIARKSLVARHSLPEGHTITAGDLTAKRPGSGVSPMAFWDLVGTPTKKPLSPDEQI